MAKQQALQKFVFKIHSQRLRESGWDLALPLNEARRNEELVSLNDSQILRWIDELNGLENQELQAKAVKRQIAALKKETSSLENRRELHRLYDTLDELQFKADYMCLVIDSPKDYRKAVKGFSINGVQYEHLLGTTGGIKNSTIVFVNAKLAKELKRRINNDRDPEQVFIPAKLEAYCALVCSGSIPVSTPLYPIIVADCNTKFKDDVLLLDDSEPGEPKMTFMQEYDCELDASDGFGLMSYELAQRWSEDLRLDGVMSGCCIRNAFCKGMVFPFPFREFAKKVAIPNGGNNMIQDIYGDWHDINKVDLILTESMVKLWQSYPSGEDYFWHCKENRYTFAVTKTAELELENERTTNYQFLASYQLTQEQIEELVAPTLEEFKAVLGGDWAKAMLFLRGKKMRATPEYINSLENDYVKALMVEPQLIDDPYVQGQIKGMLRRKIDQAKTGVLKAHGNFQVLSGDPYALCQNIFGLEVTGLLRAGQIYSRFWAKQGIEDVLCFRAPMSCHNNIRRRQVVNNEETEKWYRYMKSVTILNAWDNTCAALNGADQ